MWSRGSIAGIGTAVVQHPATSVCCQGVSGALAPLDLLLDASFLHSELSFSVAAVSGSVIASLPGHSVAVRDDSPL